MDIKEVAGMATGSLVGVAVSAYRNFVFPSVPVIATIGLCFYEGWAIDRTAARDGYICAGAQMAAATLGFLTFGYFGVCPAGYIGRNIALRAVNAISSNPIINIDQAKSSVV